MLDGTLRLIRHIDLALVHLCDQILGRKIDQFNVVGAVDDRIGHRLADSDIGDSGDDVVEAFDTLDVKRRIDVDPGGEQLLDIHVALGMPAFRRIGMRKFIDQNDARPPGENCVEVHFTERVIPVGNRPARDDFEPLNKRLGLLAAMRLDDTGDDTVPSAFFARA